jgi:coenzyme Q-binding protein COQ10
MPVVYATRHVPWQARQMFDLVADVEAYPLFLPLCQALTVTRRAPPDAAGIVCLEALMSVGYKHVRERFASTVHLDPAALVVRIASQEKPFTHLASRWEMIPALGGGCQISFQGDFALRSRTLTLLAGSVAGRAGDRFAAAFEQRALALYGPVPKVPA